MRTVLVFISTFVVLSSTVKSQSAYDTLHIKEPKNYFNTVIFLDGYTKPNQKIEDTADLTKYISKRLGSYGVKQRSIGFYTPITTVNKVNHDSTVYSNTHYLLTGNLLSLQPQFDSLSKTHQLIKLGLGLRVVYNSGKKGVWFIDISPFLTKDITFKDDNGYFRMANSIVYSHNFSPKFNLRVGLTKSFLWGNRNYLPYLGLRIGRLDKVHFSLQIPKNMSLNFPIGKRSLLSIYTKPQGGMFTFSNKDSLYYFNSDASYFHFTRYEILSGLRFDGSIGQHFNYYIAMGTSSKNNITFYSQKANSSNNNTTPYNNYFYVQNLKPTGYINIGMVFRFGKTRSYYNNTNMYDIMDLNNTMGVGDNNINPGSNIPVNKNIKQSKLNLADIQDLIDTNEF